jgi:hypothetical protein
MDMQPVLRSAFVTPPGEPDWQATLLTRLGRATPPGEVDRATKYDASTVINLIVPSLR